jgi:hypothetical protein
MTDDIKNESGEESLLELARMKNRWTDKSGTRLALGRTTIKMDFNGDCVDIKRSAWPAVIPWMMPHGTVLCDEDKNPHVDILRVEFEVTWAYELPDCSWIESVVTRIKAKNNDAYHRFLLPSDYLFGDEHRIKIVYKKIRGMSVPGDHLGFRNKLDKIILDGDNHKIATYQFSNPGDMTIIPTD